MNKTLKRSTTVCCLLSLALLAGCSQDSSQEAMTAAEDEGNGLKLFKPITGAQPLAPDVIARIENETITFSEVNTMLNSSAVVGLSIPALGTPERDVVRITLLDKMVSANLIYLDAVEKGLDRDPEYQRAMQRFSNGILADLYFRENLADDIQISEEDIQAVFETSVVPGTQMTSPRMHARNPSDATSSTSPIMKAGIFLSPWLFSCAL